MGRTHRCPGSVPAYLAGHLGDFGTAQRTRTITERVNAIHADVPLLEDVIRDSVRGLCASVGRAFDGLDLGTDPCRAGRVRALTQLAGSPAVVEFVAAFGDRFEPTIVAVELIGDDGCALGVGLGVGEPKSERPVRYLTLELRLFNADDA